MAAGVSGDAFIENSQGFLGKRGQLFGIGEAVAFLPQFLVLAGFQPGSFDLLCLEGQHLGAAVGILLGGAQVVQFAAED